jgi:uncharacterized membrane protein YfcA
MILSRGKEALAVQTCTYATAGIVLYLTHAAYNSHSSINSHPERLLLGILDEDEEIPSLFPFRTVDYVGFLCAVVGLILAAGAGIGGGGILVPIFILIFAFPVKHSIPLASVTVLGGAIANNILNARKTTPDGKPAIDWDLMVQLEPMTMAGALIGADLNDILPDVVLVILLFLLLSFTAYKTLQKAHKLHQEESQEFEKSQHEAIKLLASGKNPDEEVPTTDTTASSNSSYGSTTSDSPTSSSSIGISQAQQAGKAAVELSLLFLVVTILNLLKGGPQEGGGGPAGLTVCGNACFWAIEALIMFIIVAFSGCMRFSILNRIQSGSPVLSDIEWDEHNTLLYPLYAIVAGLVAGLFGVGGGIIKGPLMLALGKPPIHITLIPSHYDYPWLACP